MEGRWHYLAVGDPLRFTSMVPCVFTHVNWIKVDPNPGVGECYWLCFMSKETERKGSVGLASISQPLHFGA